MRTIAGKIGRMLIFFESFGWLGIYALFFPVNFQQDSRMKNNGDDILSFPVDHRGYFSGTWKQFNEQKWW